MAEKLTDEQLVDIVTQEFKTSLGAPGGDISDERGRAWEYYLSKPLGNEEEGSSQVVTSDVADVVDGMMPSLIRLFTTADNLVSFDPVGPEDEQAAQQASDYVNHIFFKKNPSFEILFFAIFDALIQKTGIIKAWWDESEEVTSESYEGLSEIEFLDLLEDDELEVVEKSDSFEETVDDDGNVVVAPVIDVEFRRVTKVGRVTVETVPPDQYRISADARSLDPSKARMVGQERDDVTRDELLSMGFDEKLVDSLSAEGDSLNSAEKQARKDKSDDQAANSKSIDRSQDKITLREAYIKVDADGDGRAELMQIFTAGGKLLSKDPADRQPLHMLCASPLPHKHIGQAPGEKVMDVQEVSSELLRQTLNNLYRTNQPEHGVWEQAIGDNTMDDLLTTRVGGVNRFARPMTEAYAAMTVPFTAGASFPMIEYFDKVKRDRTGISSDGEGLSPEALKNIQTSVLAQSVDLSKMKIELVARILAETGFKSLFRHIHELTLKHQQKAEIVKLRNQWVKVNPKEWRTRRDMTVNIGLGIGTREQNLIHLNAIWEKQVAMADSGGMNLTVTPKNVYNTAAELVKNANLKQPEMFFTDPGDKKAPPPADEQQQLQQMQLEVQQRQQQLDAEKQQIAQQKNALDREREKLKHEREMGELQRKKEADEDKFTIAMENVKTRLTELELSSGVDVPGSGV